MRMQLSVTDADLEAYKRKGWVLERHLGTNPLGIHSVILRHDGPPGDKRN